MRKLQRGMAVVAAASLAFGLAGPVLADDPADPAPGEAPRALDAMLDAVHEQAGAAGVAVEQVLGQVLTTAVPDGAGGLEEITAPFGRVLERLAADRALADGEVEGEDPGSGDGGDGGDGTTGFAGTPRTNAGNVMHVAADLEIVNHGIIPRTEDPASPEVPYPYDVAESDWTPDTPIVPGVNPFLLTPLVAPELSQLDPGLPPVLAMHWGGRLTSVQGGDWAVLGAHSAGTTPIGSNVDTTDRSEDEDATWPLHLPGIDPVNLAGVAELEGDTNPLEDGELLVPDTAIDFVGFAMVVNDGSCTRSSTNVPFTQSKVVIDICVGAGVILGDGVSFFDGEGPVDLRADLAPLWEPAPDEVRAVLDEADGALDQVGVTDLIEAVQDAAGEGGPPDLGDLPGEDPDDGDGPGELGGAEPVEEIPAQDDGEARDPRSLLRGLDRLLP